MDQPVNQSSGGDLGGQLDQTPSSQPQSGGQKPRGKLLPIIGVILIVGAFVYAANNPGQEPVASDEPMDEMEQTTSTDEGMVDEETPSQPAPQPTIPPAEEDPDPVVTPTPTPVEPECVIMGCNREVCTSSDKPVFTACVVLPEHACYQQHGVCEKQVTGECGWSQTDQLNSCLENAS